MCGRIALFTPPDRLARIFDAELSLRTDPGRHWNVGPTRPVLGLTQAGESGGGGGGSSAGGGGSSAVEGGAPDGSRVSELADPSRLLLQDYHWGLIPWKAKDRSGASRRINARAEGLLSTWPWSQSFATRRLAVVVDGFYEWHRVPGQPAQPFYFTRHDGKPLTFAGLYAYWQDPAFGQVRSCAIVTTEAGPDMEDIHHRMPVVLGDDERALWLDRDESDQDELLGLLRPSSEGTLVHHAVDRRVGAVAHDDPGVITPLVQAPDRREAAQEPAHRQLQFGGD
jgi:putative SOS response-associated peptidase YedK